MTIEDRVLTVSQYYKKKYGRRMFRLGLSLGQECPNRLNNGGCIFCLEDSYIDRQIHQYPKIDDQIEYMIPKLTKACGNVGFIAYFQENTSTFGDPDYLLKCFLEADNHPLINEIVISTRPDYITPHIISLLKNIKKELTVEIGIQSMHEKSLNFLNRHHTVQENIKALRLLKDAGFRVGVHLILGIPGEDEGDILNTVHQMNRLHVDEIKFHHLVIYENTVLAEIAERDKLNLCYSKLEDYIVLLGKIITRLNPQCVVSRFFTSNLNRTEKAINPFSGYKKKWLNELTKYLNRSDIRQGTDYRETE